MSNFQIVTKVKKSKKDHMCEQCGVLIPKGVSYVYFKGVFDGDFFAIKNHNECWDEWQRVNEDNDWDEWYDIFDDRNNEEVKSWIEKIVKIYKAAQ